MNGSFCRVLKCIEMEFWVVLEGIGVEFEVHGALPELVFSYFLDDFWVLRSKRVLRWNIGSFCRVLKCIEMEFWVVLEGIGVEFEVHGALPELVFSYFLDDFWVLRSKRVLRWNIGSFWQVLRYIEMEFWVVLEGIGAEFFKLFWVVFGCFFDDLA